MFSMTLDDYLKLPYTRIIQEVNSESGHYYVGSILELDGCQSTGDTLEELHDSLNEALEGYIEVKLEYHSATENIQPQHGNGEMVPARAHQLRSNP